MTIQTRIVVIFNHSHKNKSGQSIFILNIAKLAQTPDLGFA